MATGNFSSNNFTSAQGVSLVNEMTIVGVKEAPLLSLILAAGNVGTAQSRLHSWVERSLDSSNSSDKPEGEDAIASVYAERRQLNNALEIFSKSTKVSGTAEAIESNLLAQEIQLRLIELKRDMNREIMTSTYNDGSTGNRSMRGLVNWVTPANKVTEAALTEAAIKAGVRKLYDNSTDAGTIIAIVNADIKEQIDELYKDRFSYQHSVDVEFGANTFGLKVEKLQTNFGDIVFLLDRNAPANTITFANLDYLFIDFLRPVHYEELAKTGDTHGGVVLGEMTLRVMSDKAVSQVVIDAK